MNICNNCDSKDLKIGITKLISGSTVYPIYCQNCKTVFPKYVKKKLAIEYAAKNGSLEYVKTKTAAYMELNEIMVQCEVCDAPEAERHHWAPHHLFGNEAPRWPTSNLCRSCHRKWHNIVTPNMGQTK